MSTSYRTRPGDTFERISRQQYGVESEAARIRRANPGVEEPLSPGILLLVPTNPFQIDDRAQNGPALGLDEVSLLVEAERFRFWTSLDITQSFDGIDTISIGAPFDSNNEVFREFFRPLSYKPATVTVGGDPLFKGTLLTPEPTLGADGKSFINQGYSLPGVLSDCTLSADSLPAEFFDATFVDVANGVLGPYGIFIEYLADAGPVFEEGVVCDPTRPVWKFLVELAQQRNGILNSGPEGQLRFVKPTPIGVPAAILAQGESPLTGVEPKFNARRYYSHITGLEVIGTYAVDGSAYTVKNTQLNDALRPFSFRVQDTFGGTVKEAAEGAAGRMLGNTVTYRCTVATWRAPGGQLWAPDQTVSLLAPDAMVYSPYLFKIRRVSFKADSNSRTAVLELVLPGSFTGEIPEVLPWD